MDSEKIAVITEQLRWISQELHEIKTDVKNLNAFKFKIIGMAALCVVVIELARASGK
jgi:hypothetical protein